MAVKVAKLMRAYDSERALKIDSCGTFLTFAVTPDGKRNLHAANFCRERMCPMCQWRRSIKLGVQADKIYRELNDAGYKHVFVTLTLRNCRGDELGQTVDNLVESAQRWRRSTGYQGAFVGSYRALEITYNAKANTYHPHLHFLMTVPGDYFRPENPDYMTKERLIKDWRKAARLDYNPSVSIEAVTQKPGQSITSACAEMCKYPAKTAEINSSSVLETIDRALRGRRLIQWGGVAAEVRKRLQLDDIEHGNLVNTDEATAAGVPIEKVVYVWRYGVYIPLDMKRIQEGLDK